MVMLTEVIRLARIHAIAGDVFGQCDKADAWLRETNGALGNQPPLALLDTEEGGRLVEAVSSRVAHGIVEWSEFSGSPSARAAENIVSAPFSPAPA
jgi:hypothetical protein